MSMSWERHNKYEEKAHNDDDQLFVFGYGCKLFKDDDKARYIDQGKHLIPWMGSDTLLIDRFDARGHLQDLKRYEVNYVNNQKYTNNEDGLTEEEKEIELLCDQERFSDLKMKYEEETFHEEEMKRLRAALAADGAYHEANYVYDDESNVVEDENLNKETLNKDEKEDPFQIPSGLEPPADIVLPTSMKHFSLIEKTASFVCTQGTQMEILIKARQSGNSQFDFLSFDSDLNPFYKYLITMIKSGKYTIKSDDKSSSESESDDDDSGHYLHPSLLGALKPSKINTNNHFSLPNLPRSDKETNSYSVLVNSLKDKIHVDTKEETEAINMKLEINYENSTNNNNNQETPTNSQNWQSLLPTPPPEIEAIIDKLAQYVAKNGEDFEVTVRNRREERFEFLNPGNKYHAHYIRKKLLLLEDKRKQHAAELVNKRISKDNQLEEKLKKSPISFSLNHKDKKSSNDCDSKSMKEVDQQSKEKQLQEERKKKAMLFIKMLQSKHLLNNKDDELPKSDEVFYGPSLPNVEIPLVSENQNKSFEVENNCVKTVEILKSSSVLPFVAKDEPIKENSKHSSSKHLSSSHRHHRHHSRHSSYKSSRSSRTRSRSRSRSKSYRSHRRHKSRSRSRTRSKSSEKRKSTKSRSRSKSRR